VAEQLINHEGLVPLVPQPLVGTLLGGEQFSLRGLLQQSAVQKALPIIALIGAIGIAALAWLTFQTPAQLPLFQGLAETDKATVADALRAAGIDFELDAASGSITVAESEVHKARMLLAGQGLPKAAPSGDAVIAALPMGSSRAIEGETLRSAREVDLSRTIEAIDTVKTARVHLAVSEPSVFVRDEVKSAASVMLTLQSGRSLSNSQVHAMQFLVASSVPGLEPGQVSIIDQDGNLLSQFDASAESANFKHQVQVEDRYRGAVAALLAPLVGAGNFTTEVHVDMDFSESQSTRETYPKEDTVLRREEGNKTGAGAASAAPSGIPGATSNLPPPASQIAKQPGNAQNAAPQEQSQGPTSESYVRSFDVGREISVTHQPEGQVKRVTLAVALKSGTKAIAPAELAKIEALVKGAVGFNTERGDVVAISAHSFNELKDEPPAWWDKPWIIPLARQVGGLLAALVAYLFIARPMMRSLKGRAAAKQEEGEASEIERQLLAATETAAANHALENRKRAEMVRELVKQDPKRAAFVVKKLMLQEAANG
jgi:flagellar M-ring protein FliF